MLSIEWVKPEATKLSKQNDRVGSFKTYYLSFRNTHNSLYDSWDRLQFSDPQLDN